jgi:CheY-like chemotaxis protein
MGISGRTSPREWSGFTAAGLLYDGADNSTLLSHERGLSCQANAGSAFYCQERWENRRSPPLRLSRLGGAIVYAHRFRAPCGASRWPRRLQRLGRRSVRSLELRLGTVCRSVAVGSAFLPMMTAVHNPGSPKRACWTWSKDAPDVLVDDDDPPILNLVAETLLDGGYRGTMAHSAPEALRCLEHEVPAPW